MSPDGFSALTYPSLKDENRERIEAEARTRGHAAGYAAGAAQARTDAALEAEVAAQRAEREAARAETRVQETVASLNAAVRAAGAQAVPVLETLEHQIASAAMEIAEALLGRELGRAEDSALSALQRALNPDVPAPVSIIRMNPADLAALPEKTRAEVAAELVADPSLDRGDAVAEYPHGFLDARLSTAVERMRSALGAAL